ECAAANLRKKSPGLWQVLPCSSLHGSNLCVRRVRTQRRRDQHMSVTDTVTRQTLTGEKRKENQINTRAVESLTKNVRHSQKCACRNTGVHHVGLHAKDHSASAEFYRDLLNMQIVRGSGPEDPLGDTAFLSSRPDEESHEIVLFANPVLAHVAFKVSSLAELRSLHTKAVDGG